MKRVLLLGGTGYIGGHVHDALRRRDGVRTTLLGHRRVDYRALEGEDLIVSSLERFDLEWLRVLKPDTIVHLARLAGRGRWGRARAARRGERANRRLVDALRTHSPLTHVVYVSGTLVYGDRGEDVVDESSELRPTAFAREYVRAERPWMEARESGSLPVTLVRPAWVLGGGSWFTHYFLGPARAEGRVPVYGAGENWMSLIDVQECAAAIVHIAEDAAPGKVFNLYAPGQQVRQRHFAAALGKLLGIEVSPVPSIARGKAADEALRTSLKASTTHARAAAGYPFGDLDWTSVLSKYVATT